jgi:hypothetical protein
MITIKKSKIPKELLKMLLLESLLCIQLSFCIITEWFVVYATMQNQLINHMKNIKTSILFIAVLVIIAYSLRGNFGNPTAIDLQDDIWKENGPLELSPERGRFALLYSLVEDKSFFFSTDLARFTTPDLGYKNGHYVSLFAPAVSYIAAIGYFIGKNFNASQVGAFATIAIFALLNGLLIRSLSKKLGASNTASSIAMLIYLFATPSFAYSVTLYQHQISTFLILASLNFLFHRFS